MTLRSGILLSCIIILIHFFPNVVNAQETLHLKCEKQEVIGFIKSIQSHQSLKCIELAGLGTDIKWNKLLQSLSTLPSLEEVKFISNGFKELPEEVSNLQQIKKITLIGSEELEMAACLDILSKMPLLNKITWELYYLDDVPLDIINIDHIDSLIIIDGQLADGRKFYPTVLNDQSVQHLHSQMPVPATATSTIPIEVEFITAPDGSMSEIIQDESTNASPSFQNLNFKLAKRIDSPQNVFTRTYTNVNPPLRDVNVTNEFYSIDCNTPTLIVSEQSGTQIIIPPASFVDASGDPVLGDVVVGYREFRDAADFILSGIPMTFPQGDDISLFRSAGMFEINASQNGKEVFLKDNSSIPINFQSTDTTDRYQFYSYADTSNTWVDLGTAKQGNTQITLEPRAYSNAAAYYLKTKNSNYTAAKPDTTSFADRYLSFEYTGTGRKPVWFSSGIMLYSGIERNSSISIEKIRRSRGKNTIFDITGNYNGNPEMRRINVAHWKLKSAIPYKAFKKMFPRKNQYSDIRMAEQNGNISIQLKSDSVFINLEAEPARRIEKGNKVYYKEQSLNLKSYQKALAQRQKNFERRLKKNNARMTRSAFQNQEQWEAYKKRFCRSLMTPEEKSMDTLTWVSYCDSIQKNENQILAKSKLDMTSFTRSLSISGFGIFNCDQIERLESPVVIAANYTDITGKSVHGNCLYVIDKKINGVLSYSGYRGMSPSRFALDPQNVQSIILMDKNETLQIVQLDTLKDQKIKNNQQFTFIVESSEKPQTVEEFRKKLGI